MDIATLQRNLTTSLLDPSNAEYLALIKAARNGAVYGAKVRFPHALVYVPRPAHP
jgi:peroxisomal membrane protein 4